MVTPSRIDGAQLADLSEQLKIELAPVLGLVNLLVDTELQGPPAEIVRSIKVRCEGVAERLADVASLCAFAGESTEAVEPFPVTTTMRVAAAALQADAESRRLAITTFVDPGVPRWVTGDHDAVSRVLANLVRLAIHASAPGEVQLRISAERGERSACVVGFAAEFHEGDPADSILLRELFLGIANDEQSRVWAPLALDVARALAAAVGGEFGLDEDGDRLILYAKLPLQAGHDEAAAAKPVPPVRPRTIEAPEPSTDPEALTVLIVCSSPDLTGQLLTDMMSCGYVPQLADDRGAVAEILQRDVVDVVLVEGELPTLIETLPSDVDGSDRLVPMLGIPVSSDGDLDIDGLHRIVDMFVKNG